MLLAVLCPCGTERAMVVVSTYIDGTSVFWYQRTHEVRKKKYRYDAVSEYL